MSRLRIPVSQDPFRKDFLWADFI